MDLLHEAKYFQFDDLITEIKLLWKVNAVNELQEIWNMNVTVVAISLTSNYVTSQFLLVSASTILALIQLIMKPYQSNILNIFNGFVLQLIILVSMTPLIDSVAQDLLPSITFILILLPLIAFPVMELYIHKHSIKKMTMRKRRRPNYDTSCSVSNDYMPMSDRGMIRNVIIADM